MGTYAKNIPQRWQQKFKREKIMSKPRKIQKIMPQTAAMLAENMSVSWNDDNKFHIELPDPRHDQIDQSRRRFTTLDGIDPRLAELLWEIHTAKKLIATITDKAQKSFAREFISDKEKKFALVCEVAASVCDDTFFHQVAYALKAIRDCTPKAEYVFNAWRSCGKDRALLADICRVANENLRSEGVKEKAHPDDTTGIVVTLDNRTVQDILRKLGLPAIKQNTSPRKA